MDSNGTALLVVDVQKDVIGCSYEGDAVLARIVELVDRARAAGVPVIWVQHSSPGLPLETDGWQLAEPLEVAEGEIVIHKTYGDSFEATDLRDVLEEKGIGTLIVVGCQTDACVRSTIHGAFTRGYNVTLVGDAHTTEDLTEWGNPPPEQVIAHTNVYWGEMQGAPGRKAKVIPTEELVF